MTSYGDLTPIRSALRRVTPQRALHRAGLSEEPEVPRPTDAPEVAALLTDEGFASAVAGVACELGRDPRDVRAEAAVYLREMGATQTRRATSDWARFSRWLTRAHELVGDPEQARRLRSLDRKQSLLFPFSHRSYLDGITVPAAIRRNGITPPFVLAGANLDVFPFNHLLRRSGFIYIRRSTTDNPVYRCALRWYVAQLIRNRRNLCWSIEGGRTRTGKLRPPTYGLLRYVIDALGTQPGAQASIVPVSIVYEQLHEVPLVTMEARGVTKRPEDLRWLWAFSRSQRQPFGRAFVEFGDPVPLAGRLAELRADARAAPHAVERIALETCHRINRATPVTTTAVVCLALLATDRALTLDQVLATVAPLARYFALRGKPVAGAADLTDRATVHRALDDLVRSGVLVSVDGATDTIWTVAPGQHLVAAFYRNTAVHTLVDRAVGELGLVAAMEGGENGLATADRATLRLRDLLKFDFFFPSRAEFAGEMAAELALVDPRQASGLHEFTPADAGRWLRDSDLLVAHLVLRPFLDAYLVVAEELATWDDEDPFDETTFLDECLRLGRQWALQKRLASEESVSLELFRPALRLAEHRGLVAPGPGTSKRRAEFREEIRETVRRLNALATLQQENPS
ncbi:lysophospholipid acyltransferase [Paractinoplanes brasiliensis]|uniref:Glycerol-3-phosphate acyltransferase n=1 Tax=Paractinoplanes brasiliensis TaxID=52695 RepID=A0A4V3C789_9ACTN|nr:lysophospholipid acyltransferase [Actinoplanes brasiliensis]TDO36698.1 glycerol-3-phosphate acyltransferase [Actinoplanes brasiliensis]GID32335.1 putative acyltransferase plsB1 [Actinoplanes brasiliensis]